MKRKKKYWLHLVLVVSLLGILGGCVQNNTKQEETLSSSAVVNQQTESEKEQVIPSSIKIGIILPFTGSNARIAALQYNGMELCIKNFNEAGGFKSLNGAKVEIVKADTTGAPEIGVTEIERIITKDQVSAVLGPYNSAVGSATAPIAEKYKTPYILSNCTADEILYTPYEYVYRANHSNTNDAINLIEFLKYLRDNKDAANFTKFAVVYENTDWGKGMNDALQKYLVSEYGGTVVVAEAYQANTPDFSSIISKIKASGAEITIPVAYLADSLLFTQQMAEYKCNSIILASSGGFTTPDYAVKVGEAGNYVLTVAAWDTSVLPHKPEAATQLNAQYKQLYGEELDGYASNGYLAAAVMLDAIERAGSGEREAINKALAETDLPEDHPALLLHPYTGVCFKDEVRGMTHQNSKAQGIILQVIDGRFHLVGLESLTGPDTALVWPIPGK